MLRLALLFALGFVGFVSADEGVDVSDPKQIAALAELQEKIDRIKEAVSGCLDSGKSHEDCLCENEILIRQFNRSVNELVETEHPIAPWTAQQLVEAFPFDTAPGYLLRDGDGIYGERVRRRIKSLGIDEVVTASASPWQNPCVERVIGSLRRELLEHVIILNERHLKRLLRSYLGYYHSWRTHRSLDHDAPDGGPVQSAESGKAIEFPVVHGLHHYYLPKAA